jgi:hypothetical protein
MSEPLSPQPVSPAPAASGSFFQNLIDVYFAPREAFTRIVRDARWLLPFLGFILVALAFVLIWISKMDAMQFARTTLEESAFWDRIPPEQRAQVIEQTAGRMKYAWINGVVGGTLWLLFVSLVLMFVYRFFYSAEIRFKQALSIVAWVFFATSLVTTPLTMVVLALKKDWNLNPQEVLQANLSLLLDKSTAAKTLWALFSSIDLVSIWIVVLLAAGFGVAARKSTGSALWGVGIAWALLVLAKVGFAAIF